MSQNAAVYIDGDTGIRERVKKALEIAENYGMVDGAHHKMWVIDQMARELLQSDYDLWVRTITHDDNYDYEWDTGVAP